jgi:ferrochelatase
MTSKKICYLIVNFGGPRTLTEIEPFLRELLTDRDVVRTSFPSLIHNYIFRKIARKRSEKTAKEYIHMGGGSPIYADTEAVAKALQEKLPHPLLTFHRYLPATHEAFIQQASSLESEEIRVFPLFPQFTYATTGSVARWFREKLPYTIVNKMRWIKSYPAHPAFVRAHQNNIEEFLQSHQLQQEEIALLFTAHGIPEQFVLTGDIYQSECELSFSAVARGFPKALSKLAYQSKFGPGEWLRPYTSEMSQNVHKWNEGKKHIVFVPNSFTSDHIETLCEIENEYMVPIKEQELQAYRVPALTLRKDWIDAIESILQETNLCHNQMLIRPKS